MSTSNLNNTSGRQSQSLLYDDAEGPNTETNLHQRAVYGAGDNDDDNQLHLSPVHNESITMNRSMLKDSMQALTKGEAAAAEDDEEGIEIDYSTSVRFPCPCVGEKSRACCASACGCCKCCFKWQPILTVAGIIFLTSLSSVFTSPFTPLLKKHFFGSDQTAAMVTGISQCVTSLFTTILVGPMSQALDCYGRKPFFIFAAGSALLANIVLAIVPHQVYAWMVMKDLAGLTQSSFLMVWAADVYRPQHRGKAAAVIVATATIASLFGVLVAFAPLGQAAFLWIAVVTNVIQLVMTFLCVPESLPVEKRAPRSLMTPWVIVKTISTVRLLCKGPAVRALAAIIFLIVFSTAGTTEVWVFWLNDRVGWNSSDIAFRGLESGVLAPIALLLVYPVMQRFLSPTLTLFVTLFALFAATVLFATIWAKWVMFALVAPLMSIIVIANPVIIAMIANVGDARELTGRVMALTVVSDFVSALGPLVFGVCYGMLKGPLVFIPFVLSSLMCLVACFLTAKLGKWIAMQQEEVQEQLAAEEEIRQSRLSFANAGMAGGSTSQSRLKDSSTVNSGLKEE